MNTYAALIGTPSKLTITDATGNIIVKEGEIITQGVILAVRDAGRMDDLRMSAQMAARTPEIIQVTEFQEIGQEDPTGVHPE